MKDQLPKVKSPGKRMLPLNLILLGDPAAGKAIQSSHLVKKYRLYDLDMGKELRGIRNLKSRKKYNLNLTLDRGKLTPTELVREILQYKIYNTPKHTGILFDGTPKMLGEAKLVKKWLAAAGRQAPVVLYISIPLSETLARMAGRKEYFRGKFSKRTDDTKAALKNRVRYYRKNIAAVVAYFKTVYRFEKINGLGSVLQVHKRIVDAIERKV